jgi:FkbM family methyltransferase
MTHFLKTILSKTQYLKIVDFKNNHIDGYSVKSYSQEGEDMILRRMFNDKKDGFFIDIGAHHPKRFSNTYLFYKQGWNGINIDAMPGSMKAFNKIRPKDINIECPISDTREELTYYSFNEPAINTFSKLEAEKKDGLNNYKIIEKKKLTTSTLSDILDKNLKVGQQIDFLTIDVEGLDFKVLKSANLTKYKPKVILIETLESSLNSIVNNEISTYLASFGYSIYAKSVNTVFYVDQGFEI